MNHTIGRIVPISVGDHSAEDTFVIPRSGSQKIQPALDEMFGWPAANDEPRMMNTGKPALRPPFVQTKRGTGLKIYIAGPMSSIKEFNFPAFDAAAALLESHGHEVFNPAERDRQRHGGIDISIGMSGDPEEIRRVHGFSLRDALADDTHYICTTADAIAMLPEWEGSKGARAEHALAYALGHIRIYLGRGGGCLYV